MVHASIDKELVTGSEKETFLMILDEDDEKGNSTDTQTFAGNTSLMDEYMASESSHLAKRTQCDNLVRYNGRNFANEQMAPTDSEKAPRIVTDDKPSVIDDRSVVGEDVASGDCHDGEGSVAPDHNNLQKPHHDVDFYIPSRNQRIPGKFLLPPQSSIQPANEVEDEIESPIPEIIPGMGKREFMR